MKKRILSVLICLIVVFGWVATTHGVGPIKPLKERMGLGLDIKGGVYVVLQADKEATKKLNDEELRETMEQTQTVVERRVNEMGLSEPTVTIEGKDRIRIELPGVKNAEEAIEQVGKTAQLQFILADGTLVLTGDSVKNAEAGRDDKSTSYQVAVQFDSKGAKAFGEATTRAYNGEVTSAIQGVGDGAIAIVLDNEIISAPNVNEPILGGNCSITGDFSQEEATTLAALIRGGALPIELHEITASVQSAKIGYGALERSILAGLIGLGLILLLMIVFYRGMGIAADISLLLYVVIVLNAMSYAGVVLTLPGVAGLIVAVGMAVDANVIIFSRIREELSNGRSVRVAAETGIKNALPSIIDAQVTTLIAAVILYEIGTSSVKGFAFTFMLGIIVSMFTAIAVTNLYIRAFAEEAGEKFFGGRKKREFKIPVIEKRKVFYAISAGILVMGLVFGIAKGPQYGIDFTGGTMIHLDMGKKVELSDVKKAVAEDGLENLELIYGGEKNEEIILRTTTDLTNKERAEVIDSITDKVGKNTVIAQEQFGASVGKELRNNALLAILISAICMLIYIRIRFRNWRFGGAAILGDLHDVLVVISFYMIFGITVNNPFIAGILTVVGYSINDTIVVFDRIRENMRYDNRKELVGTIDRSVGQTLGRSLMTSATTILVMIPLAIYGGETIREFVLPLMVGVLAGTYSSIFFCSPLFYDMRKRPKQGYQGIEVSRVEEAPQVKKTKTTKKRSKRYVKGHLKKSKPKKTEESFRL